MSASIGRCEQAGPKTVSVPKVSSLLSKRSNKTSVALLWDTDTRGDDVDDEKQMTHSLIDEGERHTKKCGMGQ